MMRRTIKEIKAELKMLMAQLAAMESAEAQEKPKMTSRKMPKQRRR